MVQCKVLNKLRAQCYHSNNTCSGDSFVSDVIITVRVV